jgi:hypothetical protein
MDRPEGFYDKVEIQRKKLKRQDARDKMMTDHERYLAEKSRMKERDEELGRKKDGKDKERVSDR